MGTIPPCKTNIACVLPFHYTTIALLIVFMHTTFLLWCSSAQLGPQGFLSIDCGSNLISSYADSYTGLEWNPDADIMTEGQSVPLSGYDQGPLNTMRLFAGNQTKYCYTLANSAITAGAAYLVRASFWPGTIPPYTPQAGTDENFHFKLLIDADEWTDVFIAYHAYAWHFEEIYIRAQRNSIDVCLARVSAGSDAPFLSALELRPLPSSLTSVQQMNSSNHNFLLRFRYDYGLTSSSSYTRYPLDHLDRFWLQPASNTSQVLSTTSNVSTSKIADMVPSNVLQTSLYGGTAPDNAFTIYLQLPDYATATTKEQYYFGILYFAEIDPAVNASAQRVFNILLSPDQQLNDAPIDVYAEVGPNVGYEFVAGPFLSGPPFDIIIYIKATNSSLLSPFVAAVELFKVVNTTASVGTASSDVTAIKDLKKSMNLSSYTGDPCLPMNYSYTWLTCTDINVSTSSPNIKSISLSNHFSGGKIPESINSLTMLEQLLLDGDNLQGSIPDLSALTSLETLDLSNNKLTGSIPKSLASLKNLRVLRLQNNNLTGQIPPALLTRPSLVFNLSGNPLCQAYDTCASPSPFPASSKSKSSSSAVIIGGVVAAIVVIVAITVALFCFCKIKCPFLHVTFRRSTETTVYKPLQALSIKEFTWQEIKGATDNFSSQLGEGGFGRVYRGTISNGLAIAVKVAATSSRQGLKEFLNEVELLSRVHHRNLVGLVGYCTEGSLVLVYEFMSGGSLYDHLHGEYAKASPLPWATRLRILIDAADGIDYLHNGCNPRIIHRDIKSSNILLNDVMEAKISDFGISRNTLVNETSAPSTAIMGSTGYMDPEYLSTMKLTEKADVYSFGILLLEVVCGRRVFSMDGCSEQTHIIAWSKEYIDRGVLDDIVDASLHKRYNASSVWKVLEAALGCTELVSSQRPKMSAVCLQLKEAQRLELESHQGDDI